MATKDLENLVINVLTKNQYDGVTKNPDELYLVKDADTDYVLKDSNTAQTITSDLSLTGSVIVTTPDGTNQNEVANVDYVDTELSSKQDVLTAGTGIDITNNVISSTVTVDIDNETITKNSSDELQASAIMNARTGTDVLPIWQGTEQQWEDGVGTDWYNWKTASIETQNFTVVGNPTITNKVVSNFSASNYLTFPAFDTQTANTWEIGLKFIYSPTLISLRRQNFLRCENKAIIIQANDNEKLRLFLSSNGTSWDITSDEGTTTLVNGYTYYTKLVFDGSSYKLSLSQNGTNWSEQVLVNSSLKVNMEDPIIYLGSAAENNSWVLGEMDLSECYVKVDGNTVWTPYVGTYSQCYTLSSTPTTASKVYSEPNTASVLTITSVGTGTITLSDNNTYTYNQAGDQTTYQSIGEAHPTWLCNINNVGVKIGTTMIANKADISEYLKKHQIDTNGNYTSEFEYHTANSTEPETDVTVRYNDYFGSLRCSSVGVSLVGQARYGAHITQRGEYFVTNTPTRSGYDSYTDGLIMTKGYLVNNYPDNSSLVYNNNNDKYFLEVKGIKNSEYTDSSTTLKIWEGNSTEYTEDQQSKTYYCWREIFEGVNYDFYTSTATPQVGDMAAYKSPNGNEYQITATDGSTYIELFDGDDHADRYSEGDTTVAATIDANTLCLIEGEGVKRNGVDIATKITLDNVPTQGSTNGITSGAVYSVLGDLETALHNLNSGTYGTDGFQVQLLTENIVNSGPLESEDDVESDTTDMFNEILGSGE